MKRPKKCSGKAISMNWQELTTMLRRNEIFIDRIEKELKTRFDMDDMCDKYVERKCDCNDTCIENC